MKNFRGPRWTLSGLLTLSCALFVAKVVLQVFGSYRDYFPPNFHAEFLQGREEEFFGVYQWAFTAHVISGPVVLVLGLILITSTVRNRWPRWHRRLGRFQAGLLLLCVAPSGFCMAFYAHSGPLAEAGFLALSLLTAWTAILGWKSAVQRRFDAHQRWMTRNFLLLSSAVVLRIIGGTSTWFGWDSEWIYPINAWVSWMLPLAFYEVWRHTSSMSPNGNRGEDRSAIPSRK